MRHGFLLIRKPVGPTSHDVVGSVRRLLHEPKIGHLGTLDPAAEGLLVLAVGTKGLKAIELFGKMPKRYVAEVELGSVSTTYDREGDITKVPAKAGWLPPDDASRIQALIDDRFIGKIEQVPPMHSAVHVGGERAYRKAMRGEYVELKAREATITECKVLEYKFPKLILSVACSSGTYIRSLANDLGEGMRCGAYLAGLRRTAVGEWSLDDAVSPEDAKWTDVIPLKDILKSLPGRELSDADWGEIQHGRTIPGDMPEGGVLIAWHQELPVAALEPSKKGQHLLKPRKVF